MDKGSKFKSALKEAMEEKYSHYFDENVPDHEFSEDFEMKMRKFFEDSEVKEDTAETEGKVIRADEKRNVINIIGYVSAAAAVVLVFGAVLKTESKDLKFSMGNDAISLSTSLSEFEAVMELSSVVTYMPEENMVSKTSEISKVIHESSVSEISDKKEITYAEKTISSSVSEFENIQTEQEKQSAVTTLKSEDIQTESEEYTNVTVSEFENIKTEPEEKPVSVVSETTGIDDFSAGIKEFYEIFDDVNNYCMTSKLTLHETKAIVKQRRIEMIVSDEKNKNSIMEYVSLKGYNRDMFEVTIQENYPAKPDIWSIENPGRLQIIADLDNLFNECKIKYPEADIYNGNIKLNLEAPSKSPIMVFVGDEVSEKIFLDYIKSCGYGWLSLEFVIVPKSDISLSP